MSERGEDPFDRITDALPAPMAIVTARAHDRQAGCLVGFLTQCSITPVRFLVCISKNNYTYEVAMGARVLAVHVLHDADHDRALAQLFGEQTGDEIDKFAHCAWSSGPASTPVLDGCDWFAGTILERTPYGDHTGFVLDVLETGRADRTNEPYLTFPQVKHFDPGHPA